MNESNYFTIIMACGAGLTGAVTFLFSIVMKQSSKQVDLAKDLGELKGRQEGIEKLSAQVLETVHRAIADRD